MTLNRAIRRVQIIGSWSLAVWLIFMTATYGRAEQADVDRRVLALEQVNAQTRLAVIEERLNAIDTVGKSVLTVLVLQLVLAGLNLRPRKQDGGR